MKLLLHALPVTEDYRQLIKYFVWDPEKRQCMLRLCAHCPKLPEIVDIPTRRITEVLGIDEDEPEEQIEEILSNRIEYQEWASTDRSQLTSCLAPMKEVIEITASKFRELIPHDFISVKQKEYMKNLKEKLLPRTAIILMDFSMNYSCTLQVATQSYHWSKRQATVHPAVVYLRNSTNNELQHKSICFISDDLVHDTL
ncbi:hypothetical protein FOCC_FOCC004038 [Frankliniella occidentalis]|nr:hypothetical protein FOCC_FOCC004038 [Frankliniella occidentalis]